MHIVHLKANRALPSRSIIKYSKQDLLVCLTNLLRLVGEINMGLGTVVTSMVLILLITSWWEAFVITPSSFSYSSLKHSLNVIWKQLHFSPYFYHFYQTQIWILNQYSMLILRRSLNELTIKIFCMFMLSCCFVGDLQGATINHIVVYSEIGKTRKNAMKTFVVSR